VVLGRKQWQNRNANWRSAPWRCRRGNATGFTFHKPVKIGDVVCCYADIQKVGNTSITIGLEAWALHRDDSKDRIKVTEGVFTFVALDKDGNPPTVPPE
jgi:acyl-CoA hydrolase